jgi:hypothetical protein
MIIISQNYLKECIIFLYFDTHLHFQRRHKLATGFYTLIPYTIGSYIKSVDVLIEALNMIKYYKKNGLKITDFRI